MEKPTSFTTTKRHNRLLMFVWACAIVPSLSPALLSSQNINFTQATSFTVAVDSKFIVEIAGVSPSSVEIIHKDLPLSVSFVSSMKSDTFLTGEDGTRGRGTIISYTVRFLKPGMYTLSPLDIFIDSTSHVVAFPTVTVSQNPDILVPKLHLVPQENLHQSQKTILVLDGQYFQSIEKLEWDLSENALIEKSISSIPIPSDDFPFSENTTTIAIFSYTPLTSGIVALPQISATFIAYNGHSYTVQPTLKTLTVLPPLPTPTELPPHEDMRQTDPSARTNNSAQNSPSPHVDNTAFVKNLIALRSQERHALLPFMAKNERIALEETINLQNTSETSQLWATISAVLGIALLLLGFILYKIQKATQNTPKPRLFVLCFTLATAMIFFAIFSTVKLSGQYALTLGSQLRTIPEYEASKLTNLSAGMRVRIVRTGGDWYLISLDDTRSGWILKDDCILID